MRLPVFALLTLTMATRCVGFDQEARLRRPVALALANDGQRLFVANRDSGSVSVIDTAQLSVTAEVIVGTRLSDLAMYGKHLLLLDEASHEFLVLTESDAEWTVSARAGVSEYPVRIAVDEAAQRVFLASLWSRSVTALDLSALSDENPAAVAKAGTLRLPFEPREMCITPDGKRLIVADAFAGTLAVVDTSDVAQCEFHRIPGHNIRGLAISSDGARLFVAQQELNPLAHSTRDDVHWGNMISNQLASYPLAAMSDDDADLRKNRRVTLFGEPGNAAGDPGPVTIGADGRLVVLLSGVGETAIVAKEPGSDVRRIPAGRRPVAVAADAGSRVFVANMFSDSVSVIDVAEGLSTQISLGPQSALSLAERGEELFFDARLSHDGWMSCHSCHTNGHSNGQFNDNLSDGSFGASKRVLSLAGVSDTGPWGWNGRVKSLERQVSSSVRNTMQGDEPSDEDVAAIVAFLRTLSPLPNLPDATAEGAGAEAEGGEAIFQSSGCAKCHAPPTYTSSESYDVGLTDAAGNSRFNPPSLRGAGRRHHLFHDGSATSLRDVIQVRRHQISGDLSDSQIESLLHFLQSI